MNQYAKLNYDIDINKFYKSLQFFVECLNIPYVSLSIWRLFFQRLGEINTLRESVILCNLQYDE